MQISKITLFALSLFQACNVIEYNIPSFKIYTLYIASIETETKKPS